MLQRVHARYPVAMGIVPAASTAGVAGSRPSGRGTSRVRPAGTATASATATATAAVTATATATASGAPLDATAPEREPEVERRDAGSGRWSIHRKPGPNDVPTPPRATCPSGQFCVAASARPDAGATGGHAP